MQALSAPFVLTAPPLRARVSKLDGHANKHWRIMQEEVQLEPLYSHPYRHYLPLAQLEGVQVVKEASPSTPIEPPKVSDFIIISLGLLLVFWIGNFVVPDYIFKKVFGPEAGEQDGGMDDRQRVLDGLIGGTDKRCDVAASSKNSLGSVEDGTVRGTGFGKASRRASRNRKENK